MPRSVKLLRAEFYRSDSKWTLELDALAFSSIARGSHLAQETFIRQLAEAPLVANVELRPVKYQSAGSRGARDEVLFTVVIDLHGIAAEDERA